MVEVAHKPGLAFNPYAQLQEEQERPTFGTTLGAAFRLENDVLAATDLFTRPEFETDPGFDIRAAVEGSEYRFNYPEQLGAARSADEFAAIEERIRQEEEDREILASAGGAGIAAAIGAGVLSPTMFIPLTGGARGAKGVAQAFALAGAAGVGQEAILAAAQETRTPGEVGLGIAAATVIGGLLGSTSVFLSARKARKLELDMANSRGEETILYSAGEGSQAALRKQEFSPAFRNNDLPRLDANTKPGDVVQVYDAQGTPMAVKVERGSDEVGMTFTATDGSPLKETREVFANDPRAPDAQLETVKGKPTVAKLSDDELVAKADELEQSIAALKADSKAADAVTRDRTAVLAEALRREQARSPEGASPPAQPEGTEPPRTGSAAEATPAADGATVPPMQRLADEAELLPEPKPLRDADAPDGRSIGAAETSPRPQNAVLRRGPVSGWVIDQVGKLNPVTRVISQRMNARASYWMGRLSDAGLKTQGNIDFLAHSPGGTVEARALGHQAALGKFIQEWDDAYARYVFDDNSVPEELRSSFLADIRSGVRQLPKGKMTREEFGAEVYRIGSTDAAVNDPNMAKAVAAQNEMYDYFKAVAEEAYRYRQTVDPESRRMFDPEGNLGPDVFNYIHQVYDIEKIVQDSASFKSMIREHAKELQQTAFRKAWTKMQAEVADLTQKEAEARLSDAGLDQALRRIQQESDELVDDVEFAAYERGLDEINLRLRDDDPEIAAQAKEERKAWNANRSDRVTALVKKQRQLNAERKRIEALKAKDPTGRTIDADAYKILREEMEDAFDTDWRDKGAVDMDVDRGTADFTEYGDEAAELLFNRMVGLGTRASGMEILGGARGAELSRTLNLPFDQKAQWLNTDPEHTARVYARHMSTDVELYRATGSVNGASIFDDVREEFSRVLKRAEDSGTKGKALDDLLKSQQDIERDLSVVIQRLRHQRALPENPDGIMYRMGRAALDLNVARLMGNVVLSSVPDLARPVMKAGMMRTFRDGWAPLAQGFSQLKGSRAEWRRLGVAWDPVMHNRTTAVFELLDDNQIRKTKFERGLGFLANKTGLIAGFDRWTAEMKFISAGVANGEFSHAIQTVVEGTGSAKVKQQAKELLSAHGIDERLANKIWDQFNLEGGSDVMTNGTRLPNSQAWDDYEAMSAYRAAVNKFVNDTIVTPGADRPNWMDQNLAFKLLAQFRSFTFTSTNRVVLAGLQEQDMAVMIGVIFSLAMGTVSYYTYAASRGGDTLAEATKFNDGKWADEAITRSGLLGVFGEAHALAERIPALQPYVTFSGQRTTRRAAQGTIGQVLGPSYGLTENVINVLMGLDDPTQSTLRQARQMTPYQNIFYLRQLLDQVEAAAADITGLPERRE